MACDGKGGPADERPNGVVEADTRSVAGRRIGPWELVEEIGRGGMGVVARARRADGAFEKEVAVKLVRPDLDSEFNLDRFRREVQILATLDHPNVASLLDAGALDDGSPYLVMELVEGQPIDRFCDARGLELAPRLRLLHQLCLAVHHAHQRAVIHRDIKPGNVLVSAAAVPKLLDFGIAKLLCPRGQETLTSPDQRALTLDYASPEQIEGDPLTVGTDVYSLGVLAYRLLAGRGPYDLRSGTITEVVRAILGDDPRPPSATAETPWRRRLAGDIDAIVLHALEKRAGSRYESAKAMADDIERFLAGEPVAARRAGLAYRVGKRLRRRPVATIVVAVALLVGAAATGVGLRARVQADRRERLAQELGGEVERMEWIMRAAAHLPLHDVGREAAMVRERMAAVERRMGELGPLAEAGGRYALGRGHLALGEWDAARANLQHAWDAGYQKPDAAYALGVVLAYSYVRDKDAADRMATPQARRATIERAARAYRDPALAMLRDGKAAGAGPEYVTGTIARLEGRCEEAVRWARAALEAVPWLHEARLLEGDAFMDLAVQRRDAGDPEAESAALQSGEEAYREAARLAPSDVRVHNRLLYLAKLRLVRKVFQTGEDTEHDWRAVTAAADAALRVDAGFPDTYWHLAESCCMQAEWSLARGRDPTAFVEKAIATARTGLAHHSSRANLHAALGMALLMRSRFVAGRGADPRDDLAASMGAFRDGLALEPGNLTVLVNLGNAATAAAEHAMAHGRDPRPALEEAARVLTRAVEFVPDAPNFHNNLGIVYNDLGAWRLAHGEDASADLARARSEHERALELSPSHPFAANNLGNDFQQLALDAMEYGRDPEPDLRAAEAAFRRALASRAEFAAPHLNLMYLERTRAEHARRLGLDARSALERARSSHAAAVRVNAQDALGYSYLAALAVVVAHAELEAGRSPLALLGEARILLGRALAIDESSAEAHQFAGRADLVEAGWRRDPGAVARVLGAAVARLEEAERLNSSDATIAVDLADVHRARADAALRRAPADRRAATHAIDQGLAAVARALAINPGAARPLVMRGALRALAASAAPEVAAIERQRASADLDAALAINVHLRREIERVRASLR